MIVILLFQTGRDRGMDGGVFVFGHIELGGWKVIRVSLGGASCSRLVRSRGVTKKKEEEEEWG